MEIDRDDDIELLERELNLSHALLDIAGPKRLPELISEARRGYDNAMLWIGRVRDPLKLGKVSAKLERLRERLAGSPGRAPAVAANLRLTTVR